MTDESWATDEGYSRTQFLITSTDRDGQRTTMRVGVPADVYAQVIHVIQSGKIPEYRTTSDFVRDAIAHRLHDIGELTGDPDVQVAAAQLRRQAHIDQCRRKLQENLHYVDSLEAALKDARSAGDTGMLAELIENHDPSNLPLSHQERAVQLLKTYREDLRI